MNVASPELLVCTGSFAADVAPPKFTLAEIEAIRAGTDGVMGILPSRCYYDEDIYRFEVEHVLKRHWLYVGAWDWAEKPGDYFTLEMFGEPLIIIRGQDGKLNCLVNSCRHRWSKLVDEPQGNAKLLVCPYHRWTYNLDGTLRGMSVEPIPGLDKANCSLPRIQVEEWMGLVFINFDPDASPLREQMGEMNDILGEYGLERFRSAGITRYVSNWNYKFSFETGYEAYHHAGVHAERIGDFMPPSAHTPMAFGKNWGAYRYHSPDFFAQSPFRNPFGPPPWQTPEQLADQSKDAIFLGIYPNFISFIQPHQISAIGVQHQSATKNLSMTTIAVADWAHERPGAAEHIAEEVQFMKDVQDEDTFACQMLQKGVRSQFNTRGFAHPSFESQMSHYFQWFLDHYQGTHEYS